MHVFNIHNNHLFSIQLVAIHLLQQGQVTGWLSSRVKITSVETEKGSWCDADYAYFRGALSTERSYLIQSTSVQNLLTLALAIAETSLGAAKFKMDHMTLTTTLLRVICDPRGWTWRRLRVDWTFYKLQNCMTKKSWGTQMQLIKFNVNHSCAE